VFSLETPDGDTLTVSQTHARQERLAIISHGLEGSLNSSYVLGMSQALLENGWDVISWNMRGCGGVPNRLHTWYHSGKSDDLKVVIEYALTRPHREIALIGFSVGGNITLKYLGELSNTVSPKIRKAIAISVPMDLKSSAEQLARPINRVYMEYLLRPLRARMRHKKSLFPSLFSIEGLDSIKTFREFDERFTAPFHGFNSVEHYWSASSSRRFISGITIPTLAVSSLDDPFLAPECFPFDVARDHPLFSLETPTYGGHVGFLNSYSLASTWIEGRTLEFLRNESLIDGIRESDPIRS
jgi:predicted alpha/beta-fold hydrolase